MTGNICKVVPHLKVITETNFKRLLRKFEVTLLEMNLLMVDTKLRLVENITLNYVL